MDIYTHYNDQMDEDRVLVWNRRAREDILGRGDWRGDNTTERWDDDGGKWINSSGRHKVYKVQYKINSIFPVLRRGEDGSVLRGERAYWVAFRKQGLRDYIIIACDVSQHVKNIINWIIVSDLKINCLKKETTNTDSLKHSHKCSTRMHLIKIYLAL